ncbi:hypothetical protein [Nitrosopumilus sp. b3]|uniref:hypothetical protein n=1 Tax=Nitrosopumilus sp. b3 TaxID=2109909 RepID=UPI0015F77225|nr:hypothetical protein [Nitrosopumilus sp. b3]
MSQMLHYQEPKEDKKIYDASIHCNYCGGKLEKISEYCSETCKIKDSVWHSDV